MNIYEDISKRCGGDIYIGVVGPVRTGKSTFIKKFMEKLVLPNISDEYGRMRAVDEMPQSAAGRTIMTTEPKFIPNEAVEIELSGNARMNVRMIDCVGYIVSGALGDMEEGRYRMVKTPWSDEEMPFSKAAEIGTQKVIREHSTIGLVITTDGSVTDISREGYLEAEERVIKELKEINKPFIVLLNSVNPEGERCSKIKSEMEEKYGACVLPVDCANMSGGDINSIIESILFEFPLSEISVDMPPWVTKLDDDHFIKKDIFEKALAGSDKVRKISDAKAFANELSTLSCAEKVEIENIDLGSGSVKINILTPPGLFYKILSDNTGFDIGDEGELMAVMREMSVAKKNYDRLQAALHEVYETGYGIVPPSIEELSLEEPEIVKQGGRFGVRLRASAPSIHMIRADIETEVSPIVGTEKQSEELVRYLLDEFETDPIKIWESNLFGKSLHELVNEGLQGKLSKMPEDAREKFQETLEKIINEGSGGLICILL